MRVVYPANLFRQSVVEVRVEDSDLGNSIDRQVVSLSAAANRFRSRRIVNAKHLLAIAAHLRMYPRDVIFSVVEDGRRANDRAIFISSQIHTVRECSLNQIPWHD